MTQEEQHQEIGEVKQALRALAPLDDGRIATLVADHDRLTAALEAAEAAEEKGRERERAAVVAWLRGLFSSVGHDAQILASLIEAGDHLPAPAEKGEG